MRTRSKFVTVMFRTKHLLFAVYLLGCITSLPVIHAQEDLDDPCQGLEEVSPSERCSFVRENCAGAVDAQLDYLEIYFCTLNEASGITVVLFVSCLLLFFYLLGSTADIYFSPTLSQICEKLKISSNLAGVTFLAFGNGAADVFASFSSATSLRSLYIGVGALIGAGMFVSTVVVAAVSLVAEPSIQSVPFVRDMIFYLLSMLLLFVVGIDGKCTLLEAWSLIALYVVYVLVVLACEKWSHLFTSKDIPDRLGLSSPLLGGDKRFASLLSDDGSDSVASSRGEQREVESVEMSDCVVRKSAAVSALHGGAAAAEERSRRYKHNDVYSYKPLSDLCRPETAEEKIEREQSESKRKALAEQCAVLLPPPPKAVILEGDEVLSSHHDSIHIKASTGETPVTNLQAALVDDYFRDEDYDRAFRRDESPVQRDAFKPKSAAAAAMSVKFRMAWERSLRRSGWREKSFIQKLVTVILFPWNVMRDLTIPCTDEETWNKNIAAATPFFATLFFLLSTHNISSFVWKVPVAAILLPTAACLSATVWLFTHESRPPKHSGLFVASGFVMSVLWIYLLAKELVAILQVLGKITGIPETVLGLTLLAWGNSASDFMANMAVARLGFPDMAIAGSFAGPMFNLLIGLGSSLIYLCVQSHPDSIPFQLFSSHHRVTSLAAGFLTCSLLTTLVVVSMNKFRFTRGYGFTLLGVYAIFSVLGLLMVLNVI